MSAPVTILTLLVGSILSQSALAGEITVKGFNGRDVILNSDGTWKFATPLNLVQTAGDFEIRILDVRCRTFFVARDKDEAMTTVTYVVGPKQPVTQYDPPRESVIQIIDPQTGEKLTTQINGGINDAGEGYPKGWKAIDARIMKWTPKTDTIAFQITCKKRYTAPPNEWTATFKDVPVVK